MHEPIFHPGLHFYVYRLSGTLRYTLSIAGRAPKQFELSDADFEDITPEVKSEDSTSLHGTNASAVGLQIGVTKNDGVLDMEFEGRTGGMAHWRFVGTEEQGRTLGMVATQTESPKMVETGVQTSKAKVTDAKVQTEISWKYLDSPKNNDRWQNAQLVKQVVSLVDFQSAADWMDSLSQHLFISGHRGSHMDQPWGILHVDQKTERESWIQAGKLEKEINLNDTSRK
jgi:hypothetical protein